MKKKLTNNLGLKILSVFIAFIAWLAILNIDDPTITAKISGISVKTINGDSITNAGMYYEVESNSTVSIVVKGKKSIVDTLSASDFRAEADLSKYSITNAVPIEVSLQEKYVSNPEIIEGKSQTMMISVENYITRQFEVKVQTKGEPTKGYYISEDEITASPNRINVSAPESVMKKIADVRIDVYVNDVSKEFRTIAEPKAYDSNGIYIKSDKITFGVTSISVTASPLKTKTIEVVVETVGELEDGYVLTTQTLSVDKLTIAGSKSAIDKVEKLVLTPDITGVTKKYSNTYDLNELLPSEIKIISEVTECELTLMIEEMVEKTIDFSASDIKFLNLRTDVTADYDNNAKLSLTIRGLSNTIEELDITDFAPHIDMANLVIGEQRAKVYFEEIEGVEIISSPSLRITLVDVSTPPPSNEPVESTPPKSEPPASKEPVISGVEESDIPQTSEAPQTTKKPTQSPKPVESLAPQNETVTTIDG